MAEEITGVWISTERDAIAWEQSDGGTYVYVAGRPYAEEVERLTDGWIALGGGR